MSTQSSLTYEDLYQWADSERSRQVYESDSAYTFGWMLGWAFTDYGWVEYENADNMAFLLNAADWLGE